MATFPTMGPHFVLKINLTINSWPCTDCAYWRNIYHVTDGINQGGGNKEGNFGSTGDRYPFLALNNENMVFISEKNGQTDPRDLQYPAHLNTKYKIEVHQINVEGKSMYEIFIDDVKEASIENTSPIIVQDAMVYLSANFIDAGDATIEYFYLESYNCLSGFYWSDSTSSCASKFQLTLSTFGRNHVSNGLFFRL